MPGMKVQFRRARGPNSGESVKRSVVAPGRDADVLLVGDTRAVVAGGIATGVPVQVEAVGQVAAANKIGPRSTSHHDRQVESLYLIC